MSELNIPGFIAFLRGEVTIDGHWFGGDGPIRGGIRRNFWWREHLPKLSAHIERQDAEIAQLRADLSESRRLLDEARITLVGIAGATARAWELPRNEFIDEFLPWAQSRARFTAEKIAAPVPAQPAAFLRYDGKPANMIDAFNGDAPMPQPATVPEAVAKDVSALDAAGQFNRKVAYAWFPLRISRKRQLISDCGITMPQALTESDSQWAMRALLAMLERAECRSAILSAADAEVKDARCGLVIHTPLPVFSDGPWIFSETGQSFTGDELNVEAFCRYRNALLAAPVPYGFGHLPQVATEDMQDNMRTALIDQGWTSDSAGEVDFQDIWDAAVVQFVESAEDAYAAILSAADTEVKK